MEACIEDFKVFILNKSKKKLKKKNLRINNKVIFVFCYFNLFLC